MSGPRPWPHGARAAVSLTIDNLGEAAEIELGLRAPDAPRGGHYSVRTALPIMLDTLASAQLRATFFIEGINAEIYPDALTSIAAAGHELAYHAWCHEDWSTLAAAGEAENLDRGIAALERIGVRVTGFRPPGGRIGAETLALLQARGFSYCSPAGSTEGIDGLTVLPFAWRAVDAFHVLPAFATLREHLDGDGAPGGPEAVSFWLRKSLEDALRNGSHTTLVLHTWMIEFELDAVGEILDSVRQGSDAGELWVAPCHEVAAWISEHAERFEDPPQLDETSWTAPAKPADSAM